MKVQINGFQCSYELRGETGPVLMFIHGMASTPLQWQHQAASFSGKFRVLVPALRGHGASDKPDEGYAVADQAKDVAELCRALGIESCIAVGSSMGAGVVLHLAASHPELVRGVVTVSAYRGPGPAAKEGIAKIIRTLDEKGVAAVVEFACPPLFSAATHASNPSLVAIHKAFSECTDPRVYRHLWNAVMNFDASPILDKVKCPTMLVFGADDGRTGASSQADLKKGIPHAVIRSIPHAAHCAVLEQPALFNGVLAEFLANAGLA